MADEAGDLFFILLFLILCCLFSTLFSGRRQKAESEEVTYVDSWFTNQSIKEAYDAVVREVDAWRRESETRESSKRIRIRRKRRFIVNEKEEPNIYEVSDEEIGRLRFELAEVDGGTVITTTYNNWRAKGLIANMKAQQSTKIPLFPIGKRCPVCGVPTISEFKQCPYCGQKLIED